MKADDRRHGTKSGYNNQGCRCRPCTDANTRAHKLYLLGRSPRLVNSLGTRRRIQALLALGWTHGEIGEACGRTSRNWSHNFVSTQGKVREDVAADVARAYRTLSATTPDGPYRSRGRSIAQRKGWPTPDRWLNIDDPAEQPDPGWTERAHNSSHHHDDVDEVVVERILTGDMGLARGATRAERERVVARWTRPLAELERLAGWKPERYAIRKAS